LMINNRAIAEQENKVREYICKRKDFLFVCYSVSVVLEQYHGGHTKHVISWFEKEDECPVLGCDCSIYLLKTMLYTGWFLSSSEYRHFCTPPGHNL
uniref:Zinc_ribbon_16 domain-containing protein n=1 Tax=Angiostrongylus cantonensis TaxID=6313 RepID=A0A0K0DPK1_ANGCA